MGFHADSMGFYVAKLLMKNPLAREARKKAKFQRGRAMQSNPARSQEVSDILESAPGPRSKNRIDEQRVGC